MGLNIPLWERRFATLKSLLKTLDDNKSIGARIYEEFEQAEDAADEKLNEYGNSVVRYGSLLSSFWDQLYNTTEYNIYAPVDDDVKLPVIPVSLLRKKLSSPKKRVGEIPRPGYNDREYTINGEIVPPVIYNDYAWLGVELSDWTHGVGTTIYSADYVPEVPEAYVWETLSFSDFTVDTTDTTMYVHSYKPVQVSDPTPAYIIDEDGNYIDTTAKMQLFIDAIDAGTEIFTSLEGDASMVKIHEITASGTDGVWNIRVRPVTGYSKNWIHSSLPAIGDIDTQAKMTAFKTLVDGGKVRLSLANDNNGTVMLLKTAVKDTLRTKVWHLTAILYADPFCKYEWYGKTIADFDTLNTLTMTWAGAKLSTFTADLTDSTVMFHSYNPLNTVPPIEYISIPNGEVLDSEADMEDFKQTVDKGGVIYILLAGDTPNSILRITAVEENPLVAGTWNIYGRVLSVIPEPSYNSLYNMDKTAASPIYVLANEDDATGVILNTDTQMQAMIAGAGSELIRLKSDGTILKVTSVVKVPYPYTEYVWSGVSITDFSKYEQDTLCVEMMYDLDDITNKAITMVTPGGALIMTIDTPEKMVDMYNLALKNEAHITLADGTYMRIVTVDNITGTRKYFIVCSEYDLPPVPPKPDKAMQVEWTSMRITDLLPDTSNGMALFGLYDMDDIRRPMYIIDSSTLIPTRTEVNSSREIEMLRANISGVRIRLSDGTVLKVFSILQNDLNVKQYQFECSVTSYAWAKGTLEWLKGDSVLLYNDINKIVTQWATISPKTYFESMQSHQEHMTETLNTVNNFLSLMNTQAGGGNATPAATENINSDYAYYNNQ